MSNLEPGDQSFSGAIRERLEAIEGQLAIGVRYSLIHKRLVAAGFAVSMDTFRVTLYRARLQRDGLTRRKGQGVTVSSSLTAPTEAVQELVAAKAVKPAQDQDYFKRQSVFNKPKG